MEWLSSQTDKDDIDEQIVRIPNRWIHIHYYEALNILFRVENSLRVFVYIILKNSLGDKWHNASVSHSDNIQDTISTIAKKRISQAQGFGYLGYSISSPLMYLSSGELIQLIFSDAYWKYFKKHFMGKKDVIQNKLDEIGTVRNSLAHFRPIRYDDVELIKQNAKHALVGVEACLQDITNAVDVVPTNTSDDWYLSLKTLSSPSFSHQFFQSKKGDWIRIRLIYECRIISENEYIANHHSYRVLNIITPAIIQKFAKLTALCSFVSESIANASMDEDANARFRKSISIAFSRNIIESEYEIIREQISALLKKIEEESNLIEQDHLASGEVVQAVRAAAILRKGDSGATWWKFEKESFSCSASDYDLPEYWGSVNQIENDFIAGSVKFPWMPSDISKTEFPF